MCVQNKSQIVVAIPMSHGRIAAGQRSRQHDFDRRGYVDDEVRQRHQLAKGPNIVRACRLPHVDQHAVGRLNRAFVDEDSSGYPTPPPQSFVDTDCPQYATVCIQAG